MPRLLTKTERRSLDASERRALRKVRALERWPDTDGRPPWLVATGDALANLAQKAAIILARAAAAAVLGAARSTIEGGEAKHEFAVDALLRSAGDNAITLGRAEASGLIADTFEALDLEGVL